MIIFQLSHGLALISSCADQREAISEKALSSSRFNFLFSRKTLPSNLSWLQRAFSSLVTHKERSSGDESSLTSKSESEMWCEALPMRQRPMRSHVLHLGLSSSSELEESSLEKLRLLRAHMLGTSSSGISSTSSYPQSGTSSCPRPCRWSHSGCCSCTCWRSRTSSAWGSR
jgi:hypothetical protein